MSTDNSKKVAATAAIGTVVLAVGSYFGLTLLTGEKKAEKKQEGVSADTVFSTDVAAAPAEVSAAVVEAEVSALSAEPSAEVSTEAALTDTSTETSSTDVTATDASTADPVAAAADAAVSAVADGSAALTSEDAKRIGEEVARQVAAQVAQQIVDQQLSASKGSGSGGLTAEEARKIGQEEGRRVAEEVARNMIASAPASGGGLSAAEAEEIGLAAGRRAAKQVAARTARAIVRKERANGTLVAATSPTPAASDSSHSTATEAAAETPTTSSSAEPSRSASRPAGSKAPAADALKAWWPASSGSDFALVYAGQPRGEAAIALMFNNTPNAGALGDGIKVYDERGEVVAGSWEAAANPRLVVFRGVKPGRYTVVVAPSLADSNGKAIAQPAHGPVYVAT